jgi:hypothetical protein
LRGQEAPCGECWPGLLEENVEAWEVYQLACIDSMGISPEGIISICHELGVLDAKEVLYKIGEIVRTMRTKQEENKESDNIHG